MAGQGSALAVYSALGINFTVTLVKGVGFAMTGSGAMLAETLHSAADFGNQALLAVGMRRAARPPDDQHPLGYGAEAFIWSLMSAVGMFFLGCGVSITHGVQEIMHGPEHVEAGHDVWNLGILGFAFAAEFVSFSIAMKGMNDDARANGKSLWKHLTTTDDPFGVAVLLEDSAALVGVGLALASVGLTSVTGSAVWDAYGTIAIGLLLGTVAWFLVAKNRSLLLARSVSDSEKKVLHDTLAGDPAVERLLRSNAVVTGTDSYGVTAKVDFDGARLAQLWLEGRDLEVLRQRAQNAEEFERLLKEFGEGMATQVAVEINRLEAKVREVLPKAARIDIEVG